MAALGPMRCENPDALTTDDPHIDGVKDGNPKTGLGPMRCDNPDALTNDDPMAKSMGTPSLSIPGLGTPILVWVRCVQ
jgi:hypothetical protein